MSVFNFAVGDKVRLKHSNEINHIYETKGGTFLSQTQKNDCCGKEFIVTEHRRQSAWYKRGYRLKQVDGFYHFGRIPESYLILVEKGQ